MVSISRKEIEELKDPLLMGKRKRGNDLAGYFLHLFDDNKPLQKEAIEDWHEDPGTEIPAAHIRECLEEALAEGWIEEKGSEFFITAKGKVKAQEVSPAAPLLG